MATRVVVTQEKGGRLATAGSARGRSNEPTITTQPRMTQEEVERLENSIRDLHKGIVTNSFQIGAMLVRLREMVVPSGQWRNYLSGSQQKFGFSERTAYRYVQGFEDAVNLPTTKIAALEKKGLDPAAPKVLAAVQTVTESEGSRIKPERFADLVHVAVQERRSRGSNVEPITNGEGFRRQRRQTQLYEFGRKLYEGVDPGTIEKDFATVAQKIIRDQTGAMKARLTSQGRRAA